MKAALERALIGISDLGAFVANLGSMGVLALAGVALNLIVGSYFGFEGLGVFSQALLFFLILGQVSAGGFAFATLYRLSLRDANHRNTRNFFVAMCIPVSVVGGLQALALYSGAGAIGSVFDSSTLAALLPAVGVGACFFGLNKVGACALNGLSHFKTYALVQGCRMPLMLLAALWIAETGGELTDIGWVFVASELLIFVFLFIILCFVLPAGSISMGAVLSVLYRDTGRCWKGSLIGLLSDLNTKIDLLVLSLMVSDTLVGIYALGGMFVDGLRMVLAAIQSIVNPQVAGLVSAGNRNAFDSLYNRLARVGPALSALILLAGAGVMVFIAPAVFGAEDTATSLWVFLIIGGSLLATAPAIILNQVFTQNGYPLLQTRFFAVVATTNLLLNCALVPVYGPIGAAVATAVTELLAWVVLKRWVHTLFTGRAMQ